MAATRTCKFCGQSGLAWTQIGGRFRLKEPDGSIHTCRLDTHLHREKPEIPAATSSAPVSLKDFAATLDEAVQVWDVDTVTEPPEPEGPSILETLLAEL